MNNEDGEVILWETLYVHLPEVSPWTFELQIPTINFDLPAFLIKLKDVLQEFESEANVELKAVQVQKECQHYLNTVYRDYL
jgi:hypothetical protein